jgi:signal transduction histidine kinase
MLLVALELPLVLPRKVAAWAFATLMTVLVVVGIALAQLGGFSAAPEYAGMSPTLQVIMTLGTVAGWELLAFAGGLLAATEILARQQADQLASELRIVQRRLEESSREAERLHIARELHDTIGHGLAALGVHLDMQSRRADGDAAAAFREARDASRDLLSEVRDVVSAMRREGPLDLKRSIAELLSGFTVPRVEFTVSPELHLDQAAGAHALLRCAQEGLTNVLRHSHATRVWLDLAQDERGVTLRLRDDGVGMNSAPEGNGLRGMRERLEAVGGSLRIAASPGTGVNLEAWVPGTSMKP